MSALETSKTKGSSLPATCGAPRSCASEAQTWRRVRLHSNQIELLSARHEKVSIPIDNYQCPAMTYASETSCPTKDSREHMRIPHHPGSHTSSWGTFTLTIGCEAELKVTGMVKSPAFALKLSGWPRACALIRSRASSADVAAARRKAHGVPEMRFLLVR